MSITGGDGGSGPWAAPSLSRQAVAIKAARSSLARGRGASGSGGDVAVSSGSSGSGSSGSVSAVISQRPVQR